MLPGDAQLQYLIELIGPLQFDLQLPLSSDDLLAASGPMQPILDDHRRHERLRLNGVAALQHRTSLPALPRALQWHKVVICDISRSGIRFLHSEQIFPDEQMLLVLPDRKNRYVETVRCRCLGDRRFEVGTRFVKSLRSSPSGQGFCGTADAGRASPTGI
ncbi:MAG: PilZ domain-containing protein [Pirellulaceae bacterium]